MYVLCDNCRNFNDSIKIFVGWFWGTYVANTADISDYQHRVVADGSFIMNIQPKFNSWQPGVKGSVSVKFGNAWHVVTVVAAIALTILGVWALIEHGAVGWLLLGLSGPDGYGVNFMAGGS